MAKGDRIIKRDEEWVVVMSWNQLSPEVIGPFTSSNAAHDWIAVTRSRVVAICYAVKLDDPTDEKFRI